MEKPSIQDAHGTISNDELTKAVVNLAVESWRICKVFDRMIMKLDAGEQNRYTSQFRWFNKKIEETLSGLGMHIVDVEGQRFDHGMAATPINIQEFDGNDILVIDQMIEPIIMGRDGLVKSGTVTLRKIDP